MRRSMLAHTTPQQPNTPLRHDLGRWPIAIYIDIDIPATDMHVADWSYKFDFVLNSGIAGRRPLLLGRLLPAAWLRWRRTDLTLGVQLLQPGFDILDFKLDFRVGRVAQERALLVELLKAADVVRLEGFAIDTVVHGTLLS